MTATDEAQLIELVVSDDSTDDRVREIAAAKLAAWPGPGRYVRNVPTLGMVANFNQCLELATGRWVLMLHDDDYVLPDGISSILSLAQRASDRDRVLLFGVDVVDGSGQLLRRQFPPSGYLAPSDALKRLVTTSSFVRFPGIVVHRDAYAAVGPFDRLLGSPTDIDMWVRLFARFGVRCDRRVVSAYTVHSAALSTAMFEPSTIEALMAIFDRAAWIGALPAPVVRRRQADWFYQFILAGAFRRLRDRQYARAEEVLRLFDLPRVRALGASYRWFPMRVGLSMLIRLPTVISASVIKVVGRAIGRDASR